MSKRIIIIVFIWWGIINLCSAQSVDSLMREAALQYEQNNYPLAQSTYIEALKLAEAENESIKIVEAKKAIARCHYYMRDKQAALKWLYNALETANQHHTDTLLADIYYNISVMYIETGKVDSAEKYSYKAIELFRKTKDYGHISAALAALSDIHLNTTLNYNKAKEIIQEAEHYAELSEEKSYMAFVAMKHYFLYSLLKKDFRQALPYINKAEKLYLETGNREGIMYAYNFKAECLAMLGDTTAAKYMFKWFAFKDSVFNAEKAINMAKYETLYETEKKEQDNKILQQQNKLNQLILLIIIILFVLFMVAAFWLFNRNNLKKKQQELVMLQNLQKEKERIARDLHDNVGGQLSYIIYSLDGINEEDKEKRTEVTESVSQSVRSVIGSLRETIWAISDTNIKAHDFSDKLKVFARNLFKHSNTKINFTEHIKTERELNALLSLNFYRICQEILNNAYKHAQADEVKIDLKSEGEKLVITIIDNGIGFDAAHQNKESYGLQNIRKRASEFGIALTMKTEKGKGTDYTMVV